MRPVWTRHRPPGAWKRLVTASSPSFGVGFSLSPTWDWLRNLRAGFELPNADTFFLMNYQPPSW